MKDAKYIGLDVHQATISATVLDSAGNRAHGTVDQNRSCSIKWAAKQGKFRPT
jgi:hypothetical protein